MKKLVKTSQDFLILSGFPIHPSKTACIQLYLMIIVLQDYCLICTLKINRIDQNKKKVSFNWLRLGLVCMKKFWLLRYFMFLISGKVFVGCGIVINFLQYIHPWICNILSEQSKNDMEHFFNSIFVSEVKFALRMLLLIGNEGGFLKTISVLVFGFWW